MNKLPGLSDSEPTDFQSEAFQACKEVCHVVLVPKRFSDEVNIQLPKHLFDCVVLSLCGPESPYPANLLKINR